MHWTRSSLLTLAAAAASGAIILLIGWILFAPEILAVHR